jgi:hypothetical protein
VESRHLRRKGEECILKHYDNCVLGALEPETMKQLSCVDNLACSITVIVIEGLQHCNSSDVRKLQPEMFESF